MRGREILNDLASGLLCIGLGIGLSIVHFGQGGRLHEDFGRDPGPALLPNLLLGALLLSGIVLTLRGGLAMRQVRTRPNARESASLWPAMAAMAIMVAFLPLRDVVGAAPAMAMIGAALALLGGREEHASRPITAASGAALGLAFHALFSLGLSVPL